MWALLVAKCLRAPGSAAPAPGRLAASAPVPGVHLRGWAWGLPLTCGRVRVTLVSLEPQELGLRQV